jgi:hypothetical protein
MVSSYLNEIKALAEVRGLEIAEIELTLGNHYSMQGSALQGTMLGGALPPELAVDVVADADVADLTDLVREAVVASPVNGLLSGETQSLFTLSWNGEQVPVGEVAALAGTPHPDPSHHFERAEAADVSVADELMIKLVRGEERQGPGGINSSLQDSQSRTLHVQARCKVRDDGVKVVHQSLIRPIGSDFQFLCDEAPEVGGQGLAPDAASYLAAGIGFCFMTQFGRYAGITKKQLDEYRIVQDTHFSPGGSPGSGRADPIETHVYLVSPEGEEFARKVLDMGERTCFLHATCRTDLAPELAVSVSGELAHS